MDPERIYKFVNVFKNFQELNTFIISSREFGDGVFLNKVCEISAFCAG